MPAQFHLEARLRGAGHARTCQSGGKAAAGSCLSRLRQVPSFVCRSAYASVVEFQRPLFLPSRVTNLQYKSRLQQVL